MTALTLESGVRTHGSDLASLVVAFHNRVHGGLAKWCDEDMCRTAEQVAEFIDWIGDPEPA